MFIWAVFIEDSDCISPTDELTDKARPDETTSSYNNDLRFRFHFASTGYYRNVPFSPNYEDGAGGPFFPSRS
jgi:hypothetical protein